jgi:hypothetical protein
VRSRDLEIFRWFVVVLLLFLSPIYQLSPSIPRDDSCCIQRPTAFKFVQVTSLANSQDCERTEPNQLCVVVQRPPPVSRRTANSTYWKWLCGIACVAEICIGPRWLIPTSAPRYLGRRRGVVYLQWCAVVCVCSVRCSVCCVLDPSTREA